MRDGYFWFVGRADDVIKTSGHLVGPFEVESVLMEHPAVAEAGVIGKPDPVAMESRQGLCRRSRPASSRRRAPARAARLSPASGWARSWRRRRSTFQPTLPKTRSGKIMRRLLKARELGLPEGDTSTLEGGQTRTDDNRPTPCDRAHAFPLLHQMLRIRRLEEKSAELYTCLKIRGFLHLYNGEEAVAVGVIQALTADDAVVATYREHGQALSFRTNNMIVVPLTAGEEKIGVLEVLNKVGNEPFYEEERLLLHNFAEEIAFAIRNGKMFEVVVKSYCKQRQGLSTCKGCKRPLGFLDSLRQIPGGQHRGLIF